MLALQTKIKRQIEIIGLCIEAKEPLRAVDLSELFGCEELTIKRDLNELRSYGIAIHSSKRKGIYLDAKLDAQKLKALIMQYLGLCTSEHTLDKATALMIRRHDVKALSNVVKLQRCIESRTLAVIDYVKEEGDEVRDKRIGPLQIFQSDTFWRVLAMDDGQVKQFHLNKLLDVRPTEMQFKPIPQKKIADMFRYSFRSWVGAERHVVKIHLSRVWADRVKPKQFMEEAEVTEQRADGSVVYSVTVNSLNEVAAWIVSRGAGVKVLEPVQLREIVIATAREALRNYE